MLLEIGKIIKEYENGTTTEPEITNNDLYSINQVIELYPILSKHIITNGINDGSLKVTWIGNKRFLLKIIKKNQIVQLLLLSPVGEKNNGKKRKEQIK